MSNPALRDAFAHHVWATIRLVDACVALTPEQLETAVPGTYGSIIDTVRHIVGSDSWYVSAVSTDRSLLIEEDRMELGELRAAMEGNGMSWSKMLARDLEPDAVAIEFDHDGTETHAPVAIWLAQALHHGTDHRSQVCTTLTTLGMEPPAIDVWAFGEQDGRVVEVPPTS